MEKATRSIDSHPVNAFVDLADDLNSVAQKALLIIKPHSLGVFRRIPLVDKEFPEVSDVDLVSFWNNYEEKPERLAVFLGSKKFFVDVLWVPFKSIIHAAEAARYGMIPHLLLQSKILWLRSDTIRDLVNAIKRAAYSKSAWQFRTCSIIELADAALREARLKPLMRLEKPPTILNKPFTT